MKQALYPGSFDPITNGHIDIIKRAQKIVDVVHVAVFDNPFKKPFFTSEERVELIKKIFPSDQGIIVTAFKGLLADYCKSSEISTIIRGLRAVSDFDYEFQLAHTNQKLNDNVDTIFLMTDLKYSYLSSSVVRQLAHFKSDVSAFVPKEVQYALEEKFNE
ncbi:pantetheine-phosphate adenylyltransferase [Candidatus Marinamargulisbacteria bacterium SCGC AAA071-K20]|nr:pantetheine-phosphate adenylyltransferase [Candidatus Marinamargulisbacteria bacterium SCGC AAA071-K20]